MTKSQLRRLEDLKFEIEKAKLELELQNIRNAIHSSKPVLDIPSFVRQSNVLSPKAEEIHVDPEEERMKKYDLHDPKQRIAHYDEELEIALKELKDSSDRIAELQLKKRQTKSKSERETLQGLIDAGVKSNMDIQQKVKFIKKVRSQAMANLETPSF